jgi:hypothetical protein
MLTGRGPENRAHFVFITVNKRLTRWSAWWISALRGGIDWSILVVIDARHCNPRLFFGP